MTASTKPSTLNLDVPDAQLVEWVTEMITIRAFETAADDMSVKGRIPAGIHAAIGQEAVAVGVVRALDSADVVTSTHRSHHHALAKGLPPRAVMAELYGKATGVVGGRGGSMHLADFDKGLWGSNGIVGGGLGLAMGSARGAAQLQLPRVSVGFFGDGGANTGRVWEFVNLASIWSLPLIAVCENNMYAVETPSASVTAGGSVSDRARGFGLPVETVDGQDIVAVYEATKRAADRARAGEGPTFLEMLTYRYRMHNTEETGKYRTDEEVQHWMDSKDPIAQFSARLIEAGALTQERLADITAAVDETIAEAVTFAEESPFSDLSTAAENVSVWNNWNGAQR